jgi:hypothetical protein
MKIADLYKQLQGRNLNEHIAVIYYTRDEFEGSDNGIIDNKLWEQVVSEFNSCDDVDSSVTAFINDQIYSIAKETK